MIWLVLLSCMKKYSRQKILYIVRTCHSCKCCVKIITRLYRSGVSQSSGDELDAGINQPSADSQQPGIQEGKPEIQLEPGIPRGKVTQYRLFRERGRGWAGQDKNASTGKLIRNAKPEFAEQTERIPLRKGVYFGYKYWLKY